MLGKRSNLTHPAGEKAEGQISLMQLLKGDRPIVKRSNLTNPAGEKTFRHKDLVLLPFARVDAGQLLRTNLLPFPHLFDIPGECGSLYWYDMNLTMELDVIYIVRTCQVPLYD